MYLWQSRVKNKFISIVCKLYSNYYNLKIESGFWEFKYLIQKNLSKRYYVEVKTRSIFLHI
jgi:hypothetical protein